MGKLREPKPVLVAREIAEEMKANFVEWKYGKGGHVKMVIERGGKSVFIVASATPSDHRAAMAHRKLTQKLIRNLPESHAS